MPNQYLRNGTQAIVSRLGSHRLLLYSLFSVTAVAATIANALKNHSNFYSIAIFLSKSSRSVLVLANFAFLLALLGGHIIQKIFFGSLRPNEVERLYDRLWFFVTESLLAFTIFRDEFDLIFVVMFGFLLFVKSFHWLAADRIEWMDQRPYPGPPPLFHLRMIVLFFILWMTDILMFMIAVESTLANGVGGMVLFASEYAILMATIGNIISKYLLSAYDLRRAGQRGGENAPPWENKSMFVFYIELSTDFLKLTTYLVFFTIILTFYGLPLNILRDVWVTARSFLSRLRALHRYQNATRNMNQRYPNATEEEMSAMTDRTCIICREEMTLQVVPEAGQAPQQVDGPNTTPKKLPCGHVFHFHCLRSWLERQQSCPTCRRTVLENNNTQGQQPPAHAPGGARVAGGNPPNPFGGVGAQNPPGLNNPLGNPLGLVGRLFGPPVQPPAAAAAGQVPAQQLPLNANIPLNAGNIPLQPTGVVIQYHIQYQNARQQPQTPSIQAVQAPNLPPVPQPLQPIPQFPGFVGPGGVWQPWLLQHEFPVPAADDTVAATQDRTPNRSTPPESTPSGTAARDAAAQAALRRFNDHRPGGSSNPVGTPEMPTPSQETVSTTSGTTSSATSAHSQRVEVPTLVPLYDFSSQAATGIPSSPFRQGTRAPGLGVQGVSPQSFNHRSSTSTSDPRISPHPTNPGRVPISQLPPTLTDEQLAIMDRLTREAIDERLRVLEGVSGAVFRCIDDLMRVRSTLPTSSPVTAGSSSSGANYTKASDPNTVTTPESVNSGKSTSKEPSATPEQSAAEEVISAGSDER